MDVWIEISQLSCVEEYSHVTPNLGVWIEIIPLQSRLARFAVTSYMDVWIEKWRYFYQKEDNMEYLAHISRDKQKTQSLQLHLQNVKSIAEHLGKKTNTSHIAGLAALLHDVGKYSNEFQSYIRALTYVKRGSVVHSTAGGQLLFHWFYEDAEEPEKSLIELLANVIYSHHNELKDMINTVGESPFLMRTEESIDLAHIEDAFFSEVMSFSEICDYFAKAKSEYRALLKKIEQMEAPLFQKKEIKERQRSYHSLLTKLVFSTLLDADRTDARLFSEKGTFQAKIASMPFIDYQKRLENHLEELSANPPSDQKDQQRQINELREKMSAECKAYGKKPTGVYQLSIPTGGGKTLSSFRFAIEHLLTHQKDRIIYIVPYTTVIEQSAEDIKTILQDHTNILEHHSNFLEEEGTKVDGYSKLELAKDNWDAPIVFTTMVQFLNTFYKNKAKNSRRLHNLMNSVLIVDEAQAIPAKCISLFNESINFLRCIGNTTTVLCTATQPELEHVEKGLLYNDGEMITLREEELAIFERTSLVNEVKAIPWTKDKLVSQIHHEFTLANSVLVILNRKKEVLEVYQALQADITDADTSIYYLTTHMCAAHRLTLLKEMKERLANQEKVICISTNLIEAGVNISFQIVFRALTGIDSIAQSMGRCNRHGELEAGKTIVFQYGDKTNSFKSPSMRAINAAENVAYEMFRTNPLITLNKQTIKHYFRGYFHQVKTQMKYPITNIAGFSVYDALFSRNQSLKSLFSSNSFPFVSSAAFKTAGDNFFVIENDTKGVLVPYEEGTMHIETLLAKPETLDKEDIRAMQRFVVNVYDYELDKLKKDDAITEVEVGGTVFYVLHPNFYNSNTGITVI